MEIRRFCSFRCLEKSAGQDANTLGERSGSIANFVYYITQLIEQHTGVNLSKLLVSTSVGDVSYYNELKTFKRENNYVTLHVVYARENGILEDIYISPKIEPHIKWQERRIPNGVKISKGSTVFDGIACMGLCKRFVNVGLSMMCYRIGKEERTCLGDCQLSGRMGKSLYLYCHERSCLRKSSNE